MKNAPTFCLLIILSLCLSPFQATQAALVPIKKSSVTTKKIERNTQRKNIKKTKLKFKQHKKHLHKPEQQNIYRVITAILITFLALYVIGAILLIIFGIVFGLISLWITGICLLGIPLIILLISAISNEISYRKYLKEKKLRE